MGCAAMNSTVRNVVRFAVYADTTRRVKKLKKRAKTLPLDVRGSKPPAPVMFDMDW